jgi:putative transcriptional regulator
MMIRRPVLRWLLAAAVLAAVAGRGAADERKGGPASGDSLSGQFLVASPGIGDPRFARTVIYMITHGADGAFGLIVNKVYGSGPLAEFLKGFGLKSEAATGSIRLHYGGPVERGLAFVLHTGDYKGNGTNVVTPAVSMTTGLEVLKAIAEGRGPRRSIFVLGYSGWAPGQLEGEIGRGDWLTAPADEAILFDDDEQDGKWQRAHKKAGVKL